MTLVPDIQHSVDSHILPEFACVHIMPSETAPSEITKTWFVPARNGSKTEPRWLTPEIRAGPVTKGATLIEGR